MQSVILVNGCRLLMDEQVRAYVPALQMQVDRDFLPIWGKLATAVTIGFASTADIPHLPADCWPIFLNRNSDDPGGLGWHDDQDGRIFSRVFVADCLRAGLDWGVTLSHELIELILDPDIKRVWKMPDGRLAALEACDAVEADAQAYASIGGLRVSNFVLPSYFNSLPASRFDFRGMLTAPCPALTPGGYMSIGDAAGNWTQINMDRNGAPGRRAAMPGRRRMARAGRKLDELEVFHAALP